MLDMCLPLGLEITGEHVCQQTHRVHVTAQNKARSWLLCLNCWFEVLTELKLMRFLKVNKQKAKLLVCSDMPHF